VPPILPPVDGFLFLDKAKFAASFAGDVDAETASFMADSQRGGCRAWRCIVLGQPPKLGLPP
jgi:hypothetical protein